MIDTPLLEVKGLRALLDVGAARPVVDEVSFSIATGECLGLVGESGSGKSVTARAVLGVPPRGMSVTGAVSFRGEPLPVTSREGMRSWRAAEVGTVFQDPSAVLDPTRRIGHYLGELLVQRGAVSRPELRRRCVAALSDVGIPEPVAALDRFPHQFSGGQLQRIVIAAALLGEPSLMVADEPTTALDTTTQARVVALLDTARTARGLSMLFITHDIELAMACCDRIAVMYAGRLVEIGRANSMRDGARHPYTVGLLRCRPDINHRYDTLPVIAGQHAGLDVAVEGCSFAPRCARARPECISSVPPPVGSTDVLTACFDPIDPTGSQEKMMS